MTPMKSMACRKCGKEAPSCEFYKRGAQCKACGRARVRAHRLANIDGIRAYDRARGLRPDRVARNIRVTREWRRQHRDRLAAHNAAARARLEAPALCEDCGVAKRLEKHHPDYSKPLAVVWLCKPCHAIADKMRRRLEIA